MATQSLGELQAYLPAIYQDNPFLEQFLSAFEEILLGNDKTENSAQKGLEQTIEQIADIFNPSKLAAGEVFPQNIEKNQEFLTWLSTWTAFSLRADLNLTQQGAFIAKILPLYRRRGTKENLRELLEIFTVAKPKIAEAQANEPAHSFQVTVPLPQLTPLELLRQLEISRSLIDLEKPVHTVYQLKPDFAGMRVGVQSTVGVDTILGTKTELDPATA